MRARRVLRKSRISAVRSALLTTPREAAGEPAGRHCQYPERPALPRLGRTSCTGVVPRNSKPGAILAIILISYFMILLDNSVISTGLPSIRAGLDLSPTGLSWVQDAYTLVFGGLLLLGARAGDLVGRRRLFVIGLAVFGAASLLIGVSPAGWWIIAARALQGVGAAIVAPTSLALITGYFDGEARSRAVAWYAATAGIGASLGLLVGGALTDLVSWRAAFLVNVPIAVAMIIGARAVLTRRRGSAGASTASAPCARRRAWAPWCSGSSSPARPAGGRPGWSPPCSSACCSSPPWSSPSRAPRSRSCRCGCSPAASAAAPTPPARCTWAR